MIKILFTFLCIQMIAGEVWAQSTIHLEEETLMHEMRATPFPLDGAVVKNRKVPFMWPLEGSAEHRAALDGFEEEAKKKLDPNQINYRLRIARDSAFTKEVKHVDCRWAFYNADELYADGTWFWQYGYVTGGKTKWSALLRFTVENSADPFDPPSFPTFIKKLPSSHPRVWLSEKEWDTFIEKSKSKEERNWYLQRADKVVNVAIKPIAQTINTSKLAELDSEVKKGAYLVREGRRVVDREEANTESLTRAFLLTKDRRYFEAAMRRIEEMVSWKGSPYLKGDFNESTLLSLSALAYDSFYSLLSDGQKKMLLKEIKENGGKFFQRFQNHFEAHIADNHSVQMTLRILTMAAFAAYGDLPEAATWADYCYNVWIVRFPGVNDDGGWHNGDSYFHVNIRTLIEVPWFYGRISGYDFFKDPWYKGSAMYVMFQQPPFSKSAGNGSSHLRVVKPNGPRVAYADALAKLTDNSYLADYVRTIQTAEPDIMKKGFMSKPGDLSWFRLQDDTPLPKGKGLADLPLSYVFRNTGIATFMSSWKDIKRNAMLTFRSSPYGSTSHALANQNAFNTFYAGKPLFYSSGHHVSFTDQHSIYSHRSSRAHNTILVDGMGQKIGTEGYGWIPRSYSGDVVSYVLGDASNAYGKVVSPLWLERGRVSDLEYSPQNGWDENHLKTFRRHIVQLGGADLVFIYDELEADRPVEWDYLLHTVVDSMQITQQKNNTLVRATNTNGISDAYIFAPEKLKVTQTDQFFHPAVNWLRADDKGHFAPYPNHWHVTASSSKQTTYRYATIIRTHNKKEEPAQPKWIGDHTIQVDDWIIKVNVTTAGKPSFSITNSKNNVSVLYEDSTKIIENGKETVLKDQLPDLEI
ncbi:DUF4962 domain-containing protein [Sphingobacterium sp. SGG-5]|nr:DUF4962 domain-containing protein [Sphingobacterium sp. SGG-5]